MSKIIKPLLNVARLLFGNCFQTKTEAENPENILKVIDNMTKYYQEKQKEAKND